VQKTKRNGSEQAPTRPVNCPVCNSELLDEGALIKCQNLKCDARAQASLIFFASKQALNIDGLGKEIIKTLYNAGFIRNITDIFSLKIEQLLTLEGFREKKAQNILKAIANTKKSELWRVINALGIEHIGEAASKKIARSFGLDFMNASEDDMVALDGFGVQMVKSFMEFARVNKELIDKLLLLIEPLTDKHDIAPNPLKDKNIVLTGALSVSRDSVKEFLESVGAKISSSVSSKTDFVIYGEDAGSKYDKALSLGIPLMNEYEFKQFLQESDLKTDVFV
jgi:DNA ligase (NAD+)